MKKKINQKNKNNKMDEIINYSKGINDLTSNLYG